MGHDGSSESLHRVQSQSRRLGFISTVTAVEDGILSPTLIWYSPEKYLRRRMGARRRWTKAVVSSEDDPAGDPAAKGDLTSDASLEPVRRARAREAGRSRDPEVGSRASPARKASRGGEGKKPARSRGKKGEQKDGEELQIMTDVSDDVKSVDKSSGKVGASQLLGAKASEMPQDFIDLDASPVLLKGVDLEAIEMVDNIAESESNGGNGVADNSVFRRLLRGTRYFDPPEVHSQTCFNCGKEGHVMAACLSEKRKKPCFVCGNYGHSAKHCTQGQDCYFCRKIGHVAKDCPEKNGNISGSGKLCLRCGESGHDMPSCGNDYAPEDLKEIQCYICKNYGHFCCAEFNAGPRKISCFKCGQSGHSGLGCAKSRADIGGSTTPTVCYKCGEEGHFARGCSKSVKSVPRQRDHLAPHERYLRECSYADRGTASVPRNFGKPLKNRRHPDDGRHVRSAGKSKWWADNTIDGGGTAASKKKSNMDYWHSPGSSGKDIYETPTSRGWHVDSRSLIKRQKLYRGSSSSHGLGKRFHHDYTASRFGDNVQHHSRWEYY